MNKLTSQLLGRRMVSFSLSPFSFSNKWLLLFLLIDTFDLVLQNNNLCDDGGDDNKNNHTKSKKEKEKKERGEGGGEKKDERGTLSVILKKKNNNNERGDREKGQLTGVLKMDIHCEGRASKIFKCIGGFEGVGTGKTKAASNEPTVVRTLDPSNVRDKFQQSKEKQLDIITPQAKKLDFKESIYGNHKTMVFSDEFIRTMQTMIRNEVREYMKKQGSASKESNHDGDGDGDDDNSGGGGGGGNNRKGSGGDGDGEDKSEGSMGGGTMNGYQMEYMGQPGFSYRYGYHSGYEDGGRPVEMLYVSQMCGCGNPEARSIMQLVVLV